MSLVGAIVPPGRAWNVSPASNAVLNTATDFENRPGIEVGGRLTLEPGLTVKTSDTSSSGGIDLGAGGKLVALGSASAPITFTSMNDNTSGGDSTGNAKAIPTQKDYDVAVQADEGSSVEVSHAVFRDGFYAFADACSTTPQERGTFELTDSLIDDEVSLGDCDGTQHGYVPRLAGNSFDFQGAPSGQFAAGGSYDPGALQPALLLFNIDPAGVALSGSGRNEFKGDGAGRVVALAGTTIPTGVGWVVSSSSRAVLAPWPDTNYLTSPGITVDGGLILDPGVVVKTVLGVTGIDVPASGTLDVSGSASEPVVFTAISDDTRAGDSNGDGSASAPKPGAGGIAIQLEHVSGDTSAISHAVIEYASQGLEVKYLDYALRLSDVDWAKNIEAIDVEETSGPDYAGLGNLTCVPPWLTQIIAAHNWFAPDGVPAPNIDLGSLVGVVLPTKIPGSSLAYNASGVAGMIASEGPLFGLANTVPWAIFSCLKLSVPVTAVDVDGLGGGANFPSVDG